MEPLIGLPSCSKCGTSNEVVYNFCVKCGSSLLTKVVQAQPTQPQETDDKISATTGHPLKLTIGFQEPASRLELFVRIVLLFVYGIIAGIWGFVAGLANVIQWLHILITGKRSLGLWNFVVSYFRYSARVSSYSLLLTDKRPPISGME